VLVALRRDQAAGAAWSSAGRDMSSAPMAFPPDDSHRHLGRFFLAPKATETHATALRHLWRRANHLKAWNRTAFTREV